ncbi:MAG: hypothetical protein ACK40O_06705 [Allosphingosinicella sp.]
MATIAPSAAPAWFRAAAWLAILWNAFGVAMYLSAVGLFGDPTAGLDEAQRAAAEAIPAWIMGAFAIGAFGGLIGSIGLAMRRRWAWPALLVSMLALLAMEGWILFLSGQAEAHGVAIPVAVAAVAVLLAWLAHHARARGWLR